MRALRVALTVDPYIPIPPTHQGGIERIVDFLVRGLVDRGHELTVFAHPLSKVPGKLIPYGVPPHHGVWPRLAELTQVGAQLWHLGKTIDIVHSFGRLAALLPVLPCRSLPKIQSYQRPSVPWKGVSRAVRLAKNSICFTACSASVYRNRTDANYDTGEWHTIYNGVEFDKYEFVPQISPDAPLVFLGRLEPNKGAHVAIEIAKATGRRLIIAGDRVQSGPGHDYFDGQIAPHLDGSRVRYVGPVDDSQKNTLLGSAAALLFPTFWEEAFGIVMAEAMACGTPVVAFARGSVPEVVREGVNGYACANTSEAVRAVSKLREVDRATVRNDCATRFSAPVIVGSYEALYERMVRACRME